MVTITVGDYSVLVLRSNAPATLTEANLHSAYVNRWLRVTLYALLLACPAVFSLAIVVGDAERILHDLTHSDGMCSRGGCASLGASLIWFWIMMLLLWLRLHRGKQRETEIIERAKRLAEIRNARKTGAIQRAVRMVEHDARVTSSHGTKWQIGRSVAGMPACLEVTVGLYWWVLERRNGTWRYVANGTRIPYREVWLARLQIVTRLILLGANVVMLLMCAVVAIVEPQVLSIDFWRGASASERLLAITVLVFWGALVWLWSELRARKHQDRVIDDVDQLIRALRQAAEDFVLQGHGLGHDRPTRSTLARHRPVQIKVRATGKTWTVELTLDGWSYVNVPGR